MSETSQMSGSRRFARPSLRTATMVIPRTGERVKKAFTLRRARPSSSESTEFLLAPGNHSDPNRHRELGKIDRCKEYCKSKARRGYKYATSPVGINILKCSLAYILGSLATFVPPISGLLGRNDGKHMVATVTVYFHPARTAGSMAEAILVAFAAFVYAAVVSFSSMAVSAVLGHKDLLVLGHVIVLIVFCGGGLGLIGWTKQKLGNPLVNVACSLASLALITVLTKEGAVQNGQFSYNKVWQVLKMVIMGTIASSAVALCIRPQSARNEFRDTFIKATDAMAEMLTVITRSFLSGYEQDLKDPAYLKASSQSKAAFKTLVKNMGEAKYEHYILGTEEQHKIEARLVKCLEQLVQSIGGLRSAAETQFTLLAQSESTRTPSGLDIPTLSKPSSIIFPESQSQTPEAMLSPSLSLLERRSSILASIDERPESSGYNSESETPELGRSMSMPHGLHSNLTAADMFSIFIAHLGPPMKSLAYTLREVLEELPFGPGPEYLIAINEHFRYSLVDANALFASARSEALAAVYKNKLSNKMGSVEVVADFEEVAASCGYFSSSLQDFAEDMVTFLDVLEELKENAHSFPKKRSWNWLRFWRGWFSSKREKANDDSEETSLVDETAEQSYSHEIHNPIQRLPTELLPTNSLSQKPRGEISTQYQIWKAFRVFRRDDVKYAAKVGIGSVLYAMWAFIPSTRDFYGHWRGEWGLLSYMLVCSMTIGASNTTGFQRFFGTCLGAVFAIIAWIASDDNPWVLGFFGWLVSLQCFYIIVGKGKGPMGRFIMLTYNLSALYAYSLSVRDEEDDDDEGGISPEIWEIVLHRVVAVMTGCIWGIIVTRVIWPISARRKVKKGTSLLWLKMSLIWKRGPLKQLLKGNLEDNRAPASFCSVREELELRHFLAHLDTLCNSASSEFELRGPFPEKNFRVILEATARMLDSFHAMNVVILKDLKATEGEKEILKYTKKEWTELSWRISHLFSVMASSMKLAYPLNDVLPNVEHTRDRLLAKVYEFRKTEAGIALTKDEDYELLYTYALVTGQLAHDLTLIGQEIEKLYGILNEEDLKLE
ncbi:hypothetical protein BU24DRAFT_425842 [Aaosphaeria arxii CBS 175.79]|uniref:Integral membrane bound transporter domain-containing protein n=1 Tax=Aaosphaeria arxii CBS 175.79 TaxID=1450172 RepID=A0A6A5XGG8_9PLEO|nr:uncharacterized protein BU24DRAFT_425842 [Aaosphaeria arxii CBS 175.79]KAF2012023.1 hypothetical protein BU24DRAFT_425842 [Aaosphaeria arxii CBS 175.79]